MSSTGIPSQQRLSPAVLIVGAITFLVVVSLTAIHQPTYLYNDAFQHVSAARSVAAGDGYQTSIVYYDQNYEQATIPVPQTVWPPGIAALSSLFVLFGLDALTAVFAVSVLGLMLCPLFAMMTARTLNLGPSARILFPLSTVCLGLLVYITLRAGTEGPFIAATLLALAGAARLSYTPDAPRLALLMIAIGTTLAVTIRYNGLFLVVSTGCWFLLNSITSRSMRPFLHGVVSLAPAAAIGLGILIRNLTYTGSLTGGPVSESWASPAMVLRTLVEALVSTIGFNPSRPLQLFLMVLLVAAIGLTVVALTLHLVRRIKGGDDNISSAQRDVVTFCLAYLLVSVLMLVAILAPRALDALGYRYLLPLLPFWVCIAAILWQRRKTPAVNGVSALLAQPIVRRSALYATVLLILVGNGLALRAEWQAMRDDSSLRDVTASLDALLIDDQTLRERLQQSTSAASPVLSSSSQRIGGLTGWPVLGLTPGSYSLSEWTADEVYEVVRQFGVCYVLLHQIDTESRSGTGRQLFTDLRQGRVPSWLNELARSELLTVYQVADCRVDTS